MKIKDNKPYSIFDWVKNIIDSKKDWESYSDEQKKTFNSFMIHRLISMNPRCIDVVNYIQSLNIKDNKKLYKIYCDFIPQSKNTYSPYIKSTKKKISVEVIPYVSKHFECSSYEASEYLELTDKEWITDILVKQGVDEKEIKKLLK